MPRTSLGHHSACEVLAVIAIACAVVAIVFFRNADIYRYASGIKEQILLTAFAEESNANECGNGPLHLLAD